MADLLLDALAHACVGLEQGSSGHYVHVMYRHAAVGESLQAHPGPKVDGIKVGVAPEPGHARSEYPD